MAAVGVAVIPQLEQAKVDRAKMDIQQHPERAEDVLREEGQLPRHGPGPQSARRRADPRAHPDDPWETEYVYMKEGSTPVIISYGKDKAPGGAETDADISSKDSAPRSSERLMTSDPRDREDKTTGLSPAAIAVGVGAAALVWLALDALKRFL
jgi:general secretion pathway protein G